MQHVKLKLDWLHGFKLSHKGLRFCLTFVVNYKVRYESNVASVSCFVFLCKQTEPSGYTRLVEYHLIFVTNGTTFLYENV